MWANKTVVNFMIYILVFVENCLYYEAINDFSEKAKKPF